MGLQPLRINTENFTEHLTAGKEEISAFAVSSTSPSSHLPFLLFWHATVFLSEESLYLQNIAVMKTTYRSLFSEASLRYIQQTLHASRQEILAIIRHTRVSADAIAMCLRRQQSKQRFRQR